MTIRQLHKSDEFVSTKKWQLGAQCLNSVVTKQMLHSVGYKVSGPSAAAKMG